MSPPPQPIITISESNTATNSSSLEELFALLDIVPEEEHIVPPPNAGALTSWQNLIIGQAYWGRSTGFGCSPNWPVQRFTVTDITHFPDGGAMIWTGQPALAWGVGASCESAVGPRNRFWLDEANNLHS